MKNLLVFVGTALLRKWLLQDRASEPFTPASLLPGQFRVNAPYLEKLAKRYVRLAITAFVFSLFFVAGSVMAINAVAQSFDLFGVFVAGSVFYTGFFLALLSALAVGITLWSAGKRRIPPEPLYYFESFPEPEPAEQGRRASFLGAAESFLSGLGSRRRQEPPLHPAEAPLAPQAAPSPRGEELGNGQAS